MAILTNEIQSYRRSRGRIERRNVSSSCDASDRRVRGDGGDDDLSDRRVPGAASVPVRQGGGPIHPGRNIGPRTHRLLHTMLRADFGGSSLSPAKRLCLGQAAPGLRQIRMLVGFYFPSLWPQVKPADSAITATADGLRDFQRHRFQGNSLLILDNLVADMRDALDALKHAVIVAHRDGRGYPLGLRRREKPPPVAAVRRPYGALRRRRGDQPASGGGESILAQIRNPIRKLARACR